MSHFSHILFQSVPATDVERARDFYRDVLGFAVERDNPYGDTRWIFMQIPGADTMIHFDHVPTLPDADKPRLSLMSPDVDAAAADLASRGVTITAGPDTAPWDTSIRWAMFNDSEGNPVLIQTIGGASAD